MGSPLKVRCRCGWDGAFSQDQKGLTVSCPTCDRAILVTDDEAAFSVHNVGREEFELDLETSSPLGTPVNAPQAPPRRTGRTKGQRSTGPKKPVQYDKRLPAYAQFDRGPRSRPMTAHRGKRTAAIWVGGLVFVIVAMGVFATLRRTTDEAALREARTLAEDVARLIGRGSFSQARSSFSNHQDLDEIQSEIQALLPEQYLLQIEFVRQREGEPGSSATSPDDYTATFHAPIADKTYRLFLRLSPEAQGWRISKASFRALTPGEQP